MPKKWKEYLAVFGLFGVYFALIWHSPPAFLWSLIPTYFMAMPQTTVNQHRHLTHRAVKMAKWLYVTFETGGWLCIGFNSFEWVFAHREHHAFSDKPGDPHSPLLVREDDGSYRAAEGLEGLFPAILPFNVYAWRRFIQENKERIPVVCHDLVPLQTPWTRWMRKHNTLGLPIGIAMLCTATWLVHGDPFIGAIAAFVHFVNFVFVLNPLINGLCHFPHKWLGGYQHTRTIKTDATQNNWLVSFLTGGEGLHNNHHGQQRTARFAWYWYEMPADWGYWMFILPLKWAGAIWDVKLPKQKQA